MTLWPISTLSIGLRKIIFLEMVNTIFYLRLHNTCRVSSGNPFHELQVAFTPRDTCRAIKETHQIRTWNITSVKLVMFRLYNENKYEQRMCGTYLRSCFVKCMACWKQTVTHTFKTGLASCWCRWQVRRRLNYQLMQVITRVPTLTYENSSEFSSSPNYNSCRQTHSSCSDTYPSLRTKARLPKRRWLQENTTLYHFIVFDLEVQRFKRIRSPKSGIRRLGRLDPWEWTIPFFETSGTARPATQHNITEDRNPRSLFSPKTTEIKIWLPGWQKYRSLLWINKDCCRHFLFISSFKRKSGTTQRKCMRTLG